MATNKVIAVHSRPWRVSRLCFESDGILGQINLTLGDSVAAFDFPAFHAALGSMPTFPANLSRLLFNFPQIEEFTKKYTIAELRAEPLKAALNSAINTRQNTFLARHANAPAIISRLRQSYDVAVVGSKANRLEVLTSLAESHWNELRDEYIKDERTGVIKVTESHITGKVRSQENSYQSGNSGGTSFPAYHKGGKFFVPRAQAKLDPQTGNTTRDWELTGSARPATLQMSESNSHSSGNSFSDQTQNIFNKDYSYRHPYLEGAANYQRSMISLLDQSVAQFMDGQVLPHLPRIFRNDLQNMDSGVFQRQIAYLNSRLMSPFAGVISEVYKSAGEPVVAGEPIVQVQDNTQVYLTVRVVRSEPISIGAAATVKTRLFGAPGPVTSVDGSVVAVRCLPEDNRFELEIRCGNLDANNMPVLPPGYRFDAEYTEVIT